MTSIFIHALSCNETLTCQDSHLAGIAGVAGGVSALAPIAWLALRGLLPGPGVSQWRPLRLPDGCSSGRDFTEAAEAPMLFGLSCVEVWVAVSGLQGVAGAS